MFLFYKTHTVSMQMFYLGKALSGHLVSGLTLAAGDEVSLLGGSPWVLLWPG